MPPKFENNAMAQVFTRKKKYFVYVHGVKTVRASSYFIPGTSYSSKKAIIFSKKSSQAAHYAAEHSSSAAAGSRAVLWWP